MIPTPATIRAALSAGLPRGHRLRGPTVPRNMVPRMSADEGRAWAHSPFAGALWEYGFSASRAIACAEKFLHCHPP